MASRSDQAAGAVRAGTATFVEAAAAQGITVEAVRQAFRRLYPEAVKKRTPPKCGRCGGVGHQNRTCRAELPNPTAPRAQVLPSGVSCAVCADGIDGEPHFEPIGRDDALVPVCSSCAFDEVVPREELSASDFAREPEGVDSRSARVKRHRDDLAARGICTQGEKHGPAVVGKLCQPCADKRRSPVRGAA